MSSENPYLPPAAVEVELSADSVASGARPFSLVWLLFSFYGRIPRRVFWAASIIIALVFYTIVFACVFAFGEESPVVPAVMLLAYTAVIWTSLAVQVKRWHDRDKSAWFLLVGLIPFIGPLWQFIECGCLRGTQGPNQYGPDPT